MRIRLCSLCALLMLVGCGGSPAVTQAADTTARLGEFEPLTKADAELYVNVMRAAAVRVKNMPAADRKALEIWKAFGSRPNPSQVPTPEEMAAVQRASELMSPDLTVAREMGVRPRYESIRSRVPEYGMPPMTGGGDDPLSPEERARVTERTAKFKERQRLEDATLAPYKDEIQSLQKQVYYVGREEMRPR